MSYYSYYGCLMNLFHCLLQVQSYSHEIKMCPCLYWAIACILIEPQWLHTLLLKYWSSILSFRVCKIPTVGNDWSAMASSVQTNHWPHSLTHNEFRRSFHLLLIQSWDLGRLKKKKKNGLNIIIRRRSLVYLLLFKHILVRLVKSHLCTIMKGRQNSIVFQKKNRITEWNGTSKNRFLLRPYFPLSVPPI